jgi:hypothetical protein
VEGKEEEEEEEEVMVSQMDVVYKTMWNAFTLECNESRDPFV